jgi:HK97 family phage prohead protease
MPRVNAETRNLHAEIKGFIKRDDGDIEFDFIASSEALDRYQEVVKVDGVILDNFKNNAPLLWGHNLGLGTEERPIGAIIEVAVQDDKTLRGKAVIHNITELAREVGQLVRRGFLRAVSIGFIPLKMEGNVITEWELLEISVVPIPANPEALITSAGFKSFPLTRRELADNCFKADDFKDPALLIMELAAKALNDELPPEAEQPPVEQPAETPPEATGSPENGEGEPPLVPTPPEGAEPIVEAGKETPPPEETGDEPADDEPSDEGTVAAAFQEMLATIRGAVASCQEKVKGKKSIKPAQLGNEPAGEGNKGRAFSGDINGLDDWIALRSALKRIDKEIEGALVATKNKLKS